jgi:hemerythrin-like metal-binding protein
MANLIKWSDKYSVGVVKFDNQHRKLIKQINDLHMAMSLGNGKSSLSTIINNLVIYTVEHFSDEEREMQNTNYPQYMSHKREHDKLVGKVQELQDRLTTGKVLPSIEVLSFLKEWLTNHIVKVDKQYSEHLAANGVR